MNMYLNRDEIDSLIGQAGFKVLIGSKGKLFVLDDASINNFVYLVQEDLLEKMKWEGIHTCNPDCQKPACVAVRKAVAAEREACAKLCDELVTHTQARGDSDAMLAAISCAIVIRERGQ